MTMHRASITGLPNPLKRIEELESELARLRAALEDQHASTDALWNENTALRARLQAVTRIGAMFSNFAYNVSQDMAVSERYRNQLKDMQGEWDAALAPAPYPDGGHLPGERDSLYTDKQVTK